MLGSIKHKEVNELSKGKMSCIRDRQAMLRCHYYPNTLSIHPSPKGDPETQRKFKQAPNSQNSISKEGQNRRTHTSGFKTQYKAMISKLQYQYQHRHTDNYTPYIPISDLLCVILKFLPLSYLHLQIQSTFVKSTRLPSSKPLSNDQCLENWASTYKYKVTLNITLHTKINSKQIKEPNVNAKAIKLIEENLSAKRHDLNSGNGL